MTTKTKTDIEWSVVDGSEGIDCVRLSADPIGRVIPDGVTVEVRADVDREMCREGLLEERGASVILPGGEPVRFGSTLTKPSASARVKERMRAGEWRHPESMREWVEYPKPVPYWGVMYVYANRADTGGWDDLPEGANTRFREVVASAVAFVAEHLPHLWSGSDVAAASRALASAEGDLVKARDAVKLAKAELRIAERVHARATR